MARIDTLIGQVNNYSRNGTSANTYTTAGVINNQSGVPLNDWTDIDTARQLFLDILDPNIGEPINLMPRDLIVMPQKTMVVGRILNAIPSPQVEGSLASRDDALALAEQLALEQPEDRE